MNRPQILLSTVLLLVVPAASAREHAPRVLSPHNADAYSMKTFRQFPRWRDLSGDPLAWEVYKYLIDTRTGIFHMNEVLEGDDMLSEYRTVRDPVKIINVYGYAYCGIMGPVMAGVCEDMGIGRARTLSLPLWRHMTSEVFYDDRWHYLDLDVRAAFRRPDGTLASMEEARADASLWQNRGPLFFPNDSLERTRQIYQQTAVHHYHGFHQSGHTMDYVLRQGESFTRWWRPQGGRWHHAEVYHKNDWLRRLIEQEPRGPKPNHRHFTIHDHANGRFVYQPNLSQPSNDFTDGAYDFENVAPGREGLTLASPGPGHAIFEVRTPYIIVPVVSDMETSDDDADASVVAIDATNVRLSLSLDNGNTWQSLSLPSEKSDIDLTHRVSGRYGYLLRADFDGRPGQSILRSMKMTTWVQVAPASLPSLRRGRNRMQYRTGDHHGLETRVLEIASNASDPEELSKYVLQAPERYDPAEKTSRIRGDVVVPVSSMPRSRIAWFSATGSFRTHQRQAAENTRNTISYAVGSPERFTEIYRANVPRDTEHWHCNATREVRLDSPAERVYVRYHGDPALNNFRIYAHCLDAASPSQQPVQITHIWREDGHKRTETISVRSGEEYEIEVSGTPVDESIEIAVSSDGGSSIGRHLPP